MSGFDWNQHDGKDIWFAYQAGWPRAKANPLALVYRTRFLGNGYSAELIRWKAYGVELHELGHEYDTCEEARAAVEERLLAEQSAQS